jgi:uncharacterized protein YdeI (BOF family)
MARHVRHLVVGFTVAAAWGASTASLAQQQAPPPQGPIKTETPAVTMKLDDLEDKPENYVGKTVTVEGEVDKMLGPHLFTIDERQWADAARELPVSVPAPFTVTLTLTQNAMVRVTGMVEKIPMDRLEREVGPIVDARLRDRIANRPVLVATAVNDAGSGKSLLTRKGS